MIAQVQERVNAEANRLFRKQAKADSKAAIQKDMERGLNKIIQAYTDKLGLSLTPKDGAIEIGFRHITRRDPHKVFSLNLLIGDDGVYSVRHVPAGLDISVQSLVEDLNVRGDLRAFVLGVRKQLVALHA